MKFIKSSLIVWATLLTAAMAAFPSLNDVSPDNVVYISSESVYCMIFPKYQHMDIGTSEEAPGRTQTLCTYPYNTTLQGTIPQGFFRSVAFAKGVGITGQPYVQLTGCIVPQLVDRLNPADSGGQYDSNGGVTLQGNPIGSQCLGYASYVQLIEPGGPRACLRCCIDPVDCPVTLDTAGCPTVIPGNYFDCAY